MWNGDHAKPYRFKNSTKYEYFKQAGGRKNAVFLANDYIIGKFNTFSLIQNKENNILDYVLKLISKNGQRNSAAIKPTGTTVQVKYSETFI